MTYQDRKQLSAVPGAQTSFSNIQIAASSKQTQLITGPSFTLGAPCFSWTVVEELVARGEGSARYLLDELGNLTKHYCQITFIEVGVEPDPSFERRAREKAEARGWKFEKVQGDMGLIQRLVDGDWRESEFLVVPPGHQIAAQYDAGIISVSKSSR
jgi:hypothetical protein